MGKHIIIIGGGIAGLTAGIYAQKKGFDSDIYEQQSVPGGECTGWDRRGFHIDGCIHWLTGSGPDNPLGRIWREIRALGPDVPVYQPDCFTIIECEDTTISLYRDLPKLRAHLTDVSPADKAEIDRLCDATALMKDAAIPMLPPDLMGPADIIRMIRDSKAASRIMKQFSESLADYVRRFQHPAIRRALLSVLPAAQCAYILPFTLGTICSGNGGRPAGGSRAMALRMADYYRSLGGRLFLGQSVQKIVIENGRAAGVQLAADPAGTLLRADYVIPAADIHVTLDKLLDGRYPNQQIALRDQDPVAYPTPTCVYAAFAVDADLSDLPPDFDFAVPSYTFEDQPRDRISFKHYCYEPTFAPPGKSVAVVYLAAQYGWWAALKADPEAYRQEKKRLAADLQSGLEKRFPDLLGKISSLDVATPLTYERYCSAWHGSWMPYGQTPQAKRLFLNGRIKDIENLYMAGHWLLPPGGLPVAIITGRWAVQRICKAEKAPWRW